VRDLRGARSRAGCDRWCRYRRAGDGAPAARCRHRGDPLRFRESRRRPDALGARVLARRTAHRVVRRDDRLDASHDARARAAIQSRPARYIRGAAAARPRYLLSRRPLLCDDRCGPRFCRDLSGAADPVGEGRSDNHLCKCDRDGAAARRDEHARIGLSNTCRTGSAGSWGG